MIVFGIVFAFFLIATLFGLCLGWCMFRTVEHKQNSTADIRARNQQQQERSRTQYETIAEPSQTGARPAAASDIRVQEPTMASMAAASLPRTNREEPLRYHSRTGLPSIRARRIDLHEPTAPYKDHPIYKLRRWTILLAPISIFFAILSLLTPYSYYAEPTPWIIHIVLSIISATWAFWDFQKWKHARDEGLLRNEDGDGDNPPKWPFKVIMIGDVVLAVIWFWMFCVDAAQADYGGGVIRAYTSVFALLFW